MEIAYSRCESKSQAFEVVKKGTPVILEKFQLKADIADNGEDEIKATGRGFDLVARFGESKVDIALKLSLVLRPLKGKIEDALQKSVAKMI